MNEQNVNVALLKKAYVREGEQIPEDIKNPEEETQGEKERRKERENGEGETEGKEEVEEQKKRKRGILLRSCTASLPIAFRSKTESSVLF